MEQMTGKELTTEQQLEIIEKRGARNYAFLSRWGYMCEKIVILHDIEFDYRTAFKLIRYIDGCGNFEGYYLIDSYHQKNDVTAAFYTKKEGTK